MRDTCSAWQEMTTKAKYSVMIPSFGPAWKEGDGSRVQHAATGEKWTGPQKETRPWRIPFPSRRDQDSIRMRDRARVRMREADFVSKQPLKGAVGRAVTTSDLGQALG